MLRLPPAWTLLREERGAATLRGQREETEGPGWWLPGGCGTGSRPPRGGFRGSTGGWGPDLIPKRTGEPAGVGAGGEMLAAGCPSTSGEGMGMPVAPPAQLPPQILGSFFLGGSRGNASLAREGEGWEKGGCWKEEVCVQWHQRERQSWLVTM